MVLLEDLVCDLSINGYICPVVQFYTGFTKHHALLPVLKAVGLITLAFILSRYVLERIFDTDL